MYLDSFRIWFIKKRGFSLPGLMAHAHIDRTTRAFSRRNPSIALRPCAGKAGVAKRSWWCLGIIPSNRCCQFSMISKIFSRAQDVVCKPLVYSAHCCACWIHRVGIPILHVKYRAQLLLGVGWGGMSYWVYVTLSCHNWKRNDFRYSGGYFIY